MNSFQKLEFVKVASHAVRRIVSTLEKATPEVRESLVERLGQHFRKNIAAGIPEHLERDLSKADPYMPKWNSRYERPARYEGGPLAAIDSYRNGLARPIRGTEHLDDLWDTPRTKEEAMPNAGTQFRSMLKDLLAAKASTHNAPGIA